jgi:hypothetical protein
LVATALAPKARVLAAARSPVSLTLAGHAALGFAIYVNDGAIGGIAAGLAAFLLILVMVAVAVWGKAWHAAITRVPNAPAEDTVVAWLVGVGSVALAYFRAPGSHIHGGQTPFDVVATVVLVLVASYAIDLFHLAALKPAVVAARRALLFLLALLSGALMLRLSPEPLIDVFPLHQQTAQALLAGKSIYHPGVIDVLDTFHGTYNIPAYTYLPLTAYLTTIAYAITQDTRWANLASQLVAAVLLWIVAERCARSGRPDGDAKSSAPGLVPPGIWADLVAVVLLFHPRELLVLEKSWVEPMAMPFLGGFVLAAVARKPIVASVCLGLLCASKQHLVMYLPFLALVPGVGIRGVFIAGAVALATLAPYLFPPTELYRATFVAIKNTPFRNDALALPACLYFVGVTIPSWVGFAAALVPLAWVRRVPREIGPLLLGECMMFGLFYVLGRQAFCNYYYLLDVTSLFAVAALPWRPERA